MTVILVAVARFGFGAGSGSDLSKRQEGEGGGGGGTAAPTGYIELKRGRSRFVPVVHRRECPRSSSVRSSPGS